MSTQNEIDLILVGNITVDDVYQIDEWPSQGTSNTYSSHRRSVGGIGNIIEALDGRLKVSVDAAIGDDEEAKFICNYLAGRNAEFNRHHIAWGDIPTTKAVILSSVKNDERTSFVRWGCGRFSYKPMWQKAKWAHLSYADILPDMVMSDLKESCGTLSADLCLSTAPERGLPLLKDFDYVFASETEARAYGNALYTAGPTVIVHTREWTSITWGPGADQNQVIGARQRPIQGIDVLGAGDAYCAGFILNMLKGESLAGAAQEAHEEATRFLMKRKGP